MSEPDAKRSFELPKFLRESNSDVPDPNGEPVPLFEESRLFESSTLDKGSSAALTVLAGGAGLWLFSALMLPAVGATRSARLLREQREQDVAAEIAQFDAAQQTQATPPSSEMPSSPNATP